MQSMQRDGSEIKSSLNSSQVYKGMVKLFYSVSSAIDVPSNDLSLIPRLLLLSRTYAASTSFVAETVFPYQCTCWVALTCARLTSTSGNSNVMV